MNNFKFQNRPKHRRNSSKRHNSDRSSKSFSLHNAVCDECGNDCQVPFKPSSGKPIYCSDCFEKRGGGSDNRSGQRSFRKRSFNNKTNKSHRGSIDNRSISQLTEKIEILNKKLEIIINLLSSSIERETENIKKRKENSKKPKNTKKEEVTEVLALVEKKVADLEKKSNQENIKIKPEKKTKAKPQSKPKSKEEEIHN